MHWSVSCFDGFMHFTKNRWAVASNLNLTDKLFYGFKLYVVSKQPSLVLRFIVIALAQLVVKETKIFVLDVDTALIIHIQLDIMNDNYLKISWHEQILYWLRQLGSFKTPHNLTLNQINQVYSSSSYFWFTLRFPYASFIKVSVFSIVRYANVFQAYHRLTVTKYPLKPKLEERNPTTNIKRVVRISWIACKYFDCI